MADLQTVQDFLDLLIGLPTPLAYALIGVGSALENVFPPIPSDTFLVLGGVLVDRGGLSAAGLLLCAWLSNVGGAMFVYGIARRKGPSFFEEEGWGQRLLRPHQFRRVARFYKRYGLWAIFFSRFLPVLRVVIPIFAGFAGLGVVRTLLPTAIASLLWNWVILSAGVFASRNISHVLDIVGNTNEWLLAVAGVLMAAFVAWWIHTRHEREEEREEREAREGPDEREERGRIRESLDRGREELERRREEWERRREEEVARAEAVSHIDLDEDDEVEAPDRTAGGGDTSGGVETGGSAPGNDDGDPLGPDGRPRP